MKASVCDNGEEIFIENIPELKWKERHDTSFIGSVHLALNSLGLSYSYQYLMGISGAAFRLHFHPEWCPSSGDVTAGFDVAPGLFKSLGFSCETIIIDDQSFEDIRNLYKQIVRQINKGIPVIAINLKVCPEWGLITGYLKHKPGLLCRTYFDDALEYSLAERAPWITYFLGERGEYPDEDLLFSKALQLAVTLGRTENFKEYKSGLSAFRLWIQELRKPFQLLETEGFEHHEVNLTLFNGLLDARRAALFYLRSGNRAEKLKNSRRIMAAMETEIILLEETQLKVLPSFDSDPKIWTRGMLLRQAEILEELSLMEEEWIDLIEDSLQ